MDWRLKMMKRRTLMSAFLALAGGVAAVQTFLSPAKATVLPKDRARRTNMTAHDFTFESIDGDKLPLSAWKGKPVLVINTASFCGYTSQYAGMEALWRQYKDRGLIMVAVPSNDFGGQEPGSAAEIKTFCETYDVSFPLSRKEPVIGAQAHPFYRWVVSELGEDAAPKWNFHKYLVDGNGLLVGAWPSRVTPQSKEVTTAIEGALPKA
jgi:glutathione peroxidase